QSAPAVMQETLYLDCGDGKLGPACTGTIPLAGFVILCVQPATKAGRLATPARHRAAAGHGQVRRYRRYAPTPGPRLLLVRVRLVTRPGPGPGRRVLR